MIYLDGEISVDQPDGLRENYIPLHSTDVVDYLSNHPKLASAQQQAEFREIAALVLALLHHLYRQRHQRLCYIYAPLDPDRDKLLRSVPTPSERNNLVEELLDKTRDALQRANYHKLTQEDIQQAMDAASKWGVRMRVQFDMLSDLEIYGRGHVIGQREFRDWRNFFRLTKHAVPLYQRLVVVFRTSEDLQSSEFDPRRNYMRMFKNVPRQDVDMMLPATGVHMTWLDHSKIVVPSLYAAAMTLWRFLRNVMLLAIFGVFKTLALVVLGLLAVAFGIRSMFTYRSQTQRRYLLNMAQSLYFQNLDNNAGVLLRLLEEGEQQEAGEAVLAYFCAAIARSSEAPFSLQDIDQECERILLEATGMQVDFDIQQTARLLVHLGLFATDKEGWTCLPPTQALRKLNEVWDGWYT